MASSTRRFRVALSFAGEHRPFVEAVARALTDKLGSQRVLYDKDFEAEFARPDLDTYLQDLYHDQSDLVAVFLCADYERKRWCGLEWRAIRDLIQRRGHAIMPLRFDDIEIPGLYAGDGYVPIDGRPPELIAERILQRLEVLDHEIAAEPPIEAPNVGLGASHAIDPSNPFDPWKPATPPAFAGREDTLRALESASREGRGILLVGDWRMGKSSILATYAQRAAGMGLEVRSFSGEGREAEGHRAFVAGVLAAQEPGITPKHVPEEPGQAANQLEDWCKTMECQGTGCPTILLDEAGVFLSRAEQRFLERLRGLLSARRVTLSRSRGIGGGPIDGHSLRNAFWRRRICKHRISCLLRTRSTTAAHGRKATLGDGPAVEPDAMDQAGYYLRHSYQSAPQRARAALDTVAEAGSIDLKTLDRPIRRYLRRRCLVNGDGSPGIPLLMSYLTHDE